MTKYVKTHSFALCALLACALMIVCALLTLPAGAQNGPIDISQAEIVLGESLTYQGVEQEQRIASVRLGGKEVTSYTVSGHKATDAGTYTLTVTGTGDYTGEVSCQWSIAPKNIEGAEIFLGPTPVYNGEKQSQTVKTVLIDGLAVDTYYLRGEQATDVATYTLIVYGTGNFTGSAATKWSIELHDLSGVTISLGGVQAYNGQAQTMQVKSVKLGGKDVPYTVSGNTACEVGVYRLEITIAGDEAHKMRIFWRILPELSPIEGLTVDNVKARDRAAVEQVLAMMQRADTSLADDELRSEWYAITMRCENMLIRIDAVAAEVARLQAAIGAYDPLTVSPADRQTVSLLRGDIEALLEDDNLSDEQRAVLTVLAARADELLSRVDGAGLALQDERVTAAQAISQETLKPSDAATLNEALTVLESAQRDYAGNLSEEEKAAMAAELARIRALLASLERVAAVQAMIDALPEEAEPTDLAAEDAYLAANRAYLALSEEERAMVDATRLQALASALRDYCLTVGEGVIYIKGEHTTLDFATNGRLSKLLGVSIDGEMLSKHAYNAQGGGVITLQEAYMLTLENGGHTIAIHYTDGEASGQFSVTGDVADEGFPWQYVIIPLAVFFVAITVVLIVIYVKKHKEDRAEKKAAQETEQETKTV